jgi:hypothetical protein
MPIPAAKVNENQKDYITRCYEAIKDEYDQTTGLAICYSKWKEKKMAQIAKMKRNKR